MRVFTENKKQVALKNQKGFSLLEVMVALLLIGVAVAVMVGTIGKTATTQASTNAAAAQIIADLTAIDTAVQAFKADLPDPGAGWVTASIDAELVAKGYLKQSPPTLYPSALYLMDDAFEYDGGVTPANDTIAVLADAIPATAATIPDDVCQAINTKAYGAAVGAAIPAAIDPLKNIQCYGAGGDNTAAVPVIIDRT